MLDLGRIIHRSEAESFPQTGAVLWDQDLAEELYQVQLDRDSLPFTDDGDES